MDADSTKKQKQLQIKLPPAEVQRLGDQVWNDYRNGLLDFQLQRGRFVEYYRRWRSMPDTPLVGDEGKSNFQVPLIRWNVVERLAKELDSITGDDAEVVAIADGPADAARVKKLGRYMSWLVLSRMKILRPLVKFILWKLLFGRAIAYSPWERREVHDGTKTIVDYEAPGFEPLWLDDIVVPAEDVESIQDFSFVCRRYRTTPQEMLEGERAQRYFGISDHFQEIVLEATNGLQREWEGDEMKLTADEAEGVMYQRPVSAGETLMVIEWYGKWRMLKPGVEDADLTDFSKREMDQTDLVVRVLWDSRRVVSIQKLEDLYPGLAKRRPFVESSFLSEGRYWAPGLCELLIDAEAELTANHNQATDGQQLSIKPTLVIRSGSDIDAEDAKIEPGKPLYVDNPATDVREIPSTLNIAAVQWKEQSVMTYVERLTSTNDMTLGRAPDRPNAPRTARQTMALLEQGNIVVNLFNKLLSEDMSEMLRHFWLLDYYFAPDKVFFRVTDEDAGGLFPTQDGGSWLEAADRDGRYDFRLQFANSIWSREADKERTLARYQVDMQNPLITSNPRALWEVTNAVHAALGDPNFGELVPKPPQPDLPVDPAREWALALEGEEIHVNPQDNDELHLIRHRKDLLEAERDPERDEDAYRKLAVHYVQQVEQLQQKQIVQALAEQATAAISKLGAAGGLPPAALKAYQQFPGVGMPAANPAAQPAQVFPAVPQVTHEQ
jgi:hypothetical protein